MIKYESTNVSFSCSYIIVGVVLVGCDGGPRTYLIGCSYCSHHVHSDVISCRVSTAQGKFGLHCLGQCRVRVYTALAKGLVPQHDTHRTLS